MKTNSTGSNYFMTFHTVLKTSKDYYESMRSARSIANNMTETIRWYRPNSTVTVFPYRCVLTILLKFIILLRLTTSILFSVFYVFYEQYLTIWQLCIGHLVISLVMVTFLMWIFTNLNMSSAFTLLLVNTMIIVDLLAFMYFWEVSLNAISLVNIVMVSSLYVNLKLKLNIFIKLIFSQ